MAPHLHLKDQNCIDRWSEALNRHPLDGQPAPALADLMFMRVISISALILSMTLLYFGSIAYVLNQEASAPIKLEALFKKDLERLKKAKALPTGFSTLSEIELHGGTDTAKAWIEEMAFPFSVDSKGTHKLEVLLVDWRENGKEGAMIQMNLIENSSGNMIWELGRTFILRDKSSTYEKIKSDILKLLRH